jgi:hypothetical protein
LLHPREVGCGPKAADRDGWFFYAGVHRGVTFSVDP